MRRRRLVARFRAGPAWGVGPPDAQPGWEDHDGFVDRLVERGIVVMGGPFSDWSGAMLIFEGVTREDARTIIDSDPFVVNGVFVLDEILEWTVYVDARAPD
ncbi:MAG TPA: YciI family protein [Gaiellaceae bacterium]|nr:YciI family protein [Gaiellaceae bacterium]